MTLHLPGGRDTFVYVKPDHRPADYTILNFPVDDIDAAVDALAERGVQLERYEGMEQDEKGVARGPGPVDRLVLGSRRKRPVGAPAAERLSTREIDTPHGPARVHVEGVNDPAATLALGHGAGGGGVGARDLVAVAELARGLGLSVALVEQPYIVAGRRSPAPAKQLDAAWTAVVEELSERPATGDRRPLRRRSCGLPDRRADGCSGRAVPGLSPAPVPGARRRAVRTSWTPYGCPRWWCRETATPSASPRRDPPARWSPCPEITA